MHQMRDHHEHIHLASAVQWCKEPANSVLHQEPPCDWCNDGYELGPAAPWWHRQWCRFCAWYLLGASKLPTNKENT